MDGWIFGWLLDQLGFPSLAALHSSIFVSFSFSSFRPSISSQSVFVISLLMLLVLLFCCPLISQWALQVQVRDEFIWMEFGVVENSFSEKNYKIYVSIFSPDFQSKKKLWGKKKRILKVSIMINEWLINIWAKLDKCNKLYQIKKGYNTWMNWLVTHIDGTRHM